MKRMWIALVLLACSGAPWAFGQGDAIPRVEDISLQIARYIGSREFGIAQLERGIWLGLYRLAPWLWEPPVPFDPYTELAAEFDILLVEVIVSDEDLQIDPNSQQTEQEEEFWLWILPVSATLGPPEPGPLLGGTPSYQQFPYERIDPPSANSVLMEFEIGIPELLGPNQRRLAGQIAYDAAWFLELRVANSESPDEGEFGYGEVPIYAIQNERLNPPNAPPFADAGGDQLVAAGATVTLDARGSFDSSNVGFDPNDPRVFAKDRLKYTWEWVSGPERVDPQPVPREPANSPLAQVTLDMLTPPGEPYVYRVIVEDLNSAVPSSATMNITVVSSLPVPYQPRAIITVDGGPFALGETITLNGAGSFDPSGVPLTYRWTQTNELGGPLEPDELAAQFQPLQGATSATASWAAIRTGTYYFSLVVTNPAGLSSIDRTSVVVVEPAVAASSGTRTPTNSGTTTPVENTTPDTPAPGAAACGAGGLLGLAVAPLMLLMRNRRYRA